MFFYYLLLHFTTLKTSFSVRRPNLSNIGRVQYFDGWLSREGEVLLSHACSWSPQYIIINLENRKMGCHTIIIVIIIKFSRSNMYWRDQPFFSVYIASHIFLFSFLFFIFTVVDLGLLQTQPNSFLQSSTSRSFTPLST